MKELLKKQKQITINLETKTMDTMIYQNNRFVDTTKKYKNLNEHSKMYLSPKRIISNLSKC